MTTTKNTSPSLSDRIKGYEAITQHNLIRRMPVICRLDGVSFSSWTKSLNRPSDDRLSQTMFDTMAYLVNNIQNCAFGYTQSDEISLFFRDYDKLETEPWFGNNIQKISSVTSSMATGFFNEEFPDDNDTYKLAHFDSRVFNLPKEEVTNYLIWRQQDCVRNSIQRLGQYHMGHSKIQGLNNVQIQEELKNLIPSVNWQDSPAHFRYGIFYVRNTEKYNGLIKEPIIFKENREFLNSFIYIKEKNQ